MDLIIWGGVIFLAALTHASLQLGLGCLLLLYHASLGRHIRSKTKNLVGSFISGIGLITFFGLCAACYLITQFAGGSFDASTLGIITFIMLLLAVIFWLCYYRRGRTTELWIPKPVAKFIDGRAKVTTSNTEAFTLGILTCLVELPFNIMLFTLAADSVLALSSEWQLLAVAIYTLIVILPLLIMRFAIRHGKTVVDIQRWRVKNKQFLRIVTGVCLASLALFVFAFKVWGCV